MPTPPPTLLKRCVPHFLAALRARGLAPEPLLERFGLPAALADREEARIPVARLAGLTEACAQLAGTPLFGWEVAQSLPRGAWGVLEFTARSAPSLWEALRLAVDHAELIGERVTLELREGPGAVRLIHRYAGLEPGTVGRQLELYTLSAFAHLAAALTGGAAHPRALSFVSAIPSGAAGLIWQEGLAEAFPQARLQFGAPATEIHWDRQAVLAPLPGADPALHAWLLAQAQKEARSRPHQVAWKPESVREVLAAMLDAGQAPTLQRVAEALHLSSRTLQRRLAESGTGWQEQVEAARRERAERLVVESVLPLAEIADRLGYAEVRSFIRAYKRWTGHTPGDVRARHPVASAVHASGVR